MGTLWAYRRIIGVGIAVAAAFAFYILVIAPAVFAPGARRPTSAAIGGLFVRSFGVLVPHPFCTASVITSPRGNLLLTAAHCLGKVPDSQIVFIPYYYGGTAPFGEWQVTRSTFAAGWLPGGSISSDYAFLTVSGDVQRKAGAERLGTATPLPRDATLEGYNLDGTTTVCAGHPEHVVRQVLARSDVLVEGGVGCDLCEVQRRPAYRAPARYRVVPERAHAGVVQASSSIAVEHWS